MPISRETRFLPTQCNEYLFAQLCACAFFCRWSETERGSAVTLVLTRSFERSPTLWQVMANGRLSCCRHAAHADKGQYQQKHRLLWFALVCFGLLWFASACFALLCLLACSLHVEKLSMSFYIFACWIAPEAPFRLTVKMESVVSLSLDLALER